MPARKGVVLDTSTVDMGEPCSFIKFIENGEAVQVARVAEVCSGLEGTKYVPGIVIVNNWEAAKQLLSEQGIEVEEVY